jgi:uncharacterized protein YlaN (UPF0358 family)
MGIFWDLNQSRRIRDNEVNSAEARSLAKDAAERADELQHQVDKLTLACAAMWELLRESSNLSEDDLATRMAMIDARDGKVDGTLRTPVATCPNCKKPLMRSQARCIYCGQTVATKGSVFESP